MSDPASVPGLPSLPAAPASPLAARLPRPRWRDARLVLGVLLLLASVVLGARVVAAAGATTEVVAAAADLPAGKVIAAADLRTVSVHLSDDTAGSYLGRERMGSLVGLRLTRSVARGELLPVAALGTGAPVAPYRVVPVVVKAGRLPALRPGERVDVFATYRSGGRAGADGYRTVPLLRGAVFLRQADSAGGDVVAQLQVAPQDVAPLVYASETAALDLALQGGVGDDVGDVGTTAVSAPPVAGG